MAEGDKMRCPGCGAEMNHHANKPDWGDVRGDAASEAPGTGVGVIEVHACPGCGRTETRTSPAGELFDE